MDCKVLREESDSVTHTHTIRAMRVRSRLNKKARVCNTLCRGEARGEYSASSSQRKKQKQEVKTRNREKKKTESKKEGKVDFLTVSEKGEVWGKV